jgi:hypothetical protein
MLLSSLSLDRIRMLLLAASLQEEHSLLMTGDIGVGWRFSFVACTFSLTH